MWGARSVDWRGRGRIARVTVRDVRARWLKVLLLLSWLLLAATAACALQSRFATRKVYVDAGRYGAIVGMFPAHLHLTAFRMDGREGVRVYQVVDPPLPSSPKYWELRFRVLSTGDPHAFWVAVPYWMLILIGLPLPVWTWDRRRRARARQARGLCVGCGYDLRASPDRCPECGRAVKPGAAAGPHAATASTG